MEFPPHRLADPPIILADCGSVVTTRVLKQLLAMSKHNKRGGFSCHNLVLYFQLASWVAVTVLAADPSAADIICFKDGTKMRGTLIKRTSTEVIVKLDMGTVSFAPNEIVSVEPEPLTDEDLSAIVDLALAKTKELRGRL